MSERWKPEHGELYYFITTSGDVCPDHFSRYETSSNARLIFNNYFKTEAEARAAAKKVKELLLSLHYNGTSTANDETLQDKPLPKLTAEVFDRPDCPEWAKYAVVDVQGLAYWYQYPPLADERIGVWKAWGNRRRLIDGFFDRSDWQNSLVKRPTKAAFEKMLKNYAEQQANKILQIARERRLPEQYHNGPEKTTLPDWCKPGEWVYHNSDGYYYTIKRVDVEDDYIQISDNAREYPYTANEIKTFFSPARLRPWNFEEAPFAVKCRHSITAIEYQVAKLNSAGDGYTVADCCCDVTLQGMAIYYEQMDGSPCGVLEHRENGEWVE